MAEKKHKTAAKAALRLSTSQEIVTHIVAKLKELGVDVQLEMLDLTLGDYLPVYFIEALAGSNYPYLGIVPVAHKPVLLVAFDRGDEPDIFEQNWITIENFDDFVRAYIDQRSKSVERPLMQKQRTSTDMDDDNGKWVSHKDPLLEYAVENKMATTRTEIKRIETIFYVL